MDISDSVRAVEKLLGYTFKDKQLLKDALTHPSYAQSPSYQRLEFLGDSALGLAISNFVFLEYPDLKPGPLSILRAANVSTEKLARVAVRHGLQHYVRPDSAVLDEKVRDFVLAVRKEDETVVYGGTVKAPKLLADIVEAVAAAIYVDSQLNLQALWVIFKGLLEPIVTPDILQHQPQPLRMLKQLCEKEGRRVRIKKPKRAEENYVTGVHLDGEFVVSSSSENKENEDLHVAKAALEKLFLPNEMNVDTYNYIDGTTEIAEAKQKLNVFCVKKRWKKPSYEMVKETGPPHEKKYIYSVKIKTPEEVLSVEGDEKPRVNDAENSAASLMIRGLLTTKMEPKYHYVVYSGRNPGIYSTWDKCENQVLGFSNAKHERFPSKEEAMAAWLDFTVAQKTNNASSASNVARAAATPTNFASNVVAAIPAPNVARVVPKPGRQNQDVCAFVLGFVTAFVAMIVFILVM